MASRCLRPGCDRPVAARLSYDAVSCELWLDDVEAPAPRSRVQELCGFHIDRLTVPRGWVVTDRRGDPAPVGEGPADPDTERPVATSSPPAADADRGPGADEAPLLARAFAWTGPQRSVLTKPADGADERG
jgi:hypothetical protein